MRAKATSFFNSILKQRRLAHWRNPFLSSSRRDVSDRADSSSSVQLLSRRFERLVFDQCEITSIRLLTSNRKIGLDCSFSQERNEFYTLVGDWSTAACLYNLLSAVERMLNRLESPVRWGPFLRPSVCFPFTLTPSHTHLPPDDVTV